MSSAFFAVQALLATFLLYVVAERAKALLFVAPASRWFVAALSDSLQSADPTRTLRLLRALPECWVSRVVNAAIDDDDADGIERVESAVADLRLEAAGRLALLRVAATLSSTLGLLGGILAIQAGFSGKGLLSLSAGLAQQVALDQALLHMAAGMGTAAFCFAAFTLFRSAARDALVQVAHIAARCRGAVVMARPEKGEKIAASFTPVGDG